MPHDRIRLDARATSIFEGAPSALPPAHRGEWMRINDEVREADFVIDGADQVIKDRLGNTPRSATMPEIEGTRLVQGQV